MVLFMHSILKKIKWSTLKWKTIYLKAITQEYKFTGMQLGVGSWGIGRAAYFYCHFCLFCPFIVIRYIYLAERFFCSCLNIR